MTSTSILPAWLVIPVAALAMVVVAGHLLSLQTADMPDRRRRLRIGNGLLMLFVIALLAYALGIARVSDQPPMAAPRESREFVMIWLAIIGFLGIVIFLAGLDALFTLSHTIKQRGLLRAELRDALGDDLSRRARIAPAPSSPPARRVANRAAAGETGAPPRDKR